MKSLLVVTAVALLAGCGSAPPAAPMPEEATRRPANSPAQVELQFCEANLANARRALDEEVGAERAAGSVDSKLAYPDAAADARCGAAAAGIVVVILSFAPRTDRVQLAESDVASLVEHARGAAAIRVRGCDDDDQAGNAETGFPIRRARAIVALLAARGVDPAHIRLTYPGHAEWPEHVAGARLGARSPRVEVEIYRQPVPLVILGGGARD